MRAVHLVGFRVLHLEVPPEAAAHEPPQRRPARIVLHLVRDPLVLDQLLGRQRPFGHLAVAAIGQIDLAHRRHVVERLGQRGHLDPLLVLHQGVEEPRQPAVVVDVLLGLRPGAELLAVVAEDHHRVGVLLGQLGQVVDRLLRVGEGDRVAEPLAAGEDREHAALVFGQQVAGQFRLGQAGALEVEVVEHGVFDAGVDQVAGERLLPDPLGHPQAADRGPQAVLQPAGVAADLADAVPRGDHRQDRLEVRPAEDLDPPLGRPTRPAGPRIRADGRPAIPSASR